MLIGLAFTVQFDPYIERRKRRIFLTIILLIASLVAQNYTGFLLDSDGTRPYARTIVAIYGYCVRPVVIVLFGYIVNANKIKHGIWILPMINTVIYLTALFSDICFRIDADNTFVRGPLGFTCHIVSGVLLAYLLWMTLKEYRLVRRRDFLIPVVNVSCDRHRSRLSEVSYNVSDSIRDSRHCVLLHMAAFSVCSGA